MNHSRANDQHLLAEQVVLNEIQSNHAAYEAMLKIQRWKFIRKIPNIASRIVEEANDSIRKHFLTFVANDRVLVEQDYFICTVN